MSYIPFIAAVWALSSVAFVAVMNIVKHLVARREL